MSPKAPQKKKNIKTNGSTTPKKRFSERLNELFQHNSKAFLILSLMLGTLLTLLLFDVKMSLSGDDSDYIIAAEQFWRHFNFPGFRGPLYPIFLSPFVGLFGYQLILLKSLSALSLLLSLYLFYRALRGLVPDAVLLPTLLLVSLCSYLFFYGSFTYSEPFFMLVQALFFSVFSSLFLREEHRSDNIKRDWKQYLLLATTILCMGLTRSIGYGVLGVVILYLATQTRWKALLYAVTSFLLVFGLFHLFKSVVWPSAGSAYDIQNYLAKDFYNVHAGVEDLPGFIDRLIINSRIYLSNFLGQFMGFVADRPSSLIIESTFLTLLFYGLFLLFFVLLFRKNKTLLFVGFYVGVMNFTSFLLLQTNWGQDRLIVIYYPYILLFLLGGLYYLLQASKPRWFFCYPVVLLIILFGTLSNTFIRVKAHLPVLQENILGDPLAGFTPDWKHFIQGSQWAAEHLDPNVGIISRKPTISKIYTHRDFQGSPIGTIPFNTLRSYKESGEIFFLLDSRGPRPSGDAVKYSALVQEEFTLERTEKNHIAICSLPPMLFEQFKTEAEKIDLEYTCDIDRFITFGENMGGNARLYDPEQMVRYLIDHNVHYLLLPQLRVNQQENTGYYINTVHVYIEMIQVKYPTLFRLLHTIGKEEPCEIVQFMKEDVSLQILHKQ